MNIINSFIITALAGLSTMLGYLVIYIKGNKNKIISIFLSLASGVMFIVSLIDLIPSSFVYLSNYFIIFRLLLISLFVVLGFFISNYISIITSKYNDNELNRLGILSLISIVLHNVFEGVITFMSCQIDMKLGLSMALAITLHNVPEGVSIAIPLYYGKSKKSKIFATILLAGISELLGALLTYFLLMKYINDLLLGVMLALTAGIMISIGIFSLLKEAFEYNKLNSIIGFILGIIVMIISSIFI